MTSPPIVCSIACRDGLYLDTDTCQCIPRSRDEQGQGEVVTLVDIQNQEPMRCPILSENHCNDGFRSDRNGCLSQECNSPPSCPVHSSCRKHCMDGFKVDANGCPRCECVQRDHRRCPMVLLGFRRLSSNQMQVYMFDPLFSDRMPGYSVSCRPESRRRRLRHV